MNMLDTIRIGAQETIAAQRRREYLPCPCCGTDAPLASVKYRNGIAVRFSIACEWEGCAKPLCVEGETSSEAWTNWNNQVSA